MLNKVVDPIKVKIKTQFKTTKINKIKVKIQKNIFDQFKSFTEDIVNKSIEKGLKVIFANSNDWKTNNFIKIEFIHGNSIKGSLKFHFNRVNKEFELSGVSYNYHATTESSYVALEMLKTIKKLDSRLHP